MIYLIVLSLISFSAIIFMLTKKIRETASYIEIAGRGTHTNFIVDFIHYLRNQTKVLLHDAYLNLRPHAHDIISFVVAKMYKVSSWLAREFLKFYNFIQGRKVLKNSGRQSIFIQDMGSVKGRGRI
ncbi:MAG: hypothetical protein Q7S19_01920 [bacterium]|nr:hypothetical protein [bacterium]